MAYQHLFEALQNVCGFTALESDMFEIINAYKEDIKEDIAPVLPKIEEKDHGQWVGMPNFIEGSPI